MSSFDSDNMGGFGGNEFDRFDVDEFTSTRDHDDDMVGLVDDADLKFVGGKGAAYTTVEHLEEEDTAAFVHVTGMFDGDDSERSERALIVDHIESQPVVYKSKMEHARAIYARELAKGVIVRKNIIPMFMSEALCTPAGAATYYATIHTK